MSLNPDQQKRLVAAEMAFKARKPEDTSAELIESAKKWLEYLDAGTSKLVTLAAVDPIEKLKRDMR